MSTELDQRRAAALADLDEHWGSAYLISYDEGGTWHALCKMLPAGPSLDAPTPQELRTLIRADYDRRVNIPERWDVRKIPPSWKRL